MANRSAGDERGEQRAQGLAAELEQERQDRGAKDEEISATVGALVDDLRQETIAEVPGRRVGPEGLERCPGRLRRCEH